MMMAFVFAPEMWAQTTREAYAVVSTDTDGKTLTFYYDDQKGSQTGAYDIPWGVGDPGWSESGDKDQITKVTFDPSFDDYHGLTNAFGMFANLTQLATIENLSYLHTENVTYMAGMFFECHSLTSLDLSGFDTSSVTDMSFMFVNCIKLASLDLSGFDTSKVTDMNSMFYNCYYLASLDLSRFDTSNVTDMSYMFYYCYHLSSLVLSGFNTSSVTNMNSMFYNCASLSSLDLSGFDTSKVTNMDSMFSMCSNLETIYCNEDWNGGSVTSSNNMFSSCTKLKGATTYDSGNANDITFANLTTGYFTRIEIVPKPEMLMGALIPSKGWFMWFEDDGSTYVEARTETKVFEFPKGSDVVITVQNMSTGVYDLHLMVNGIDRINDLVENAQGHFELHLNNVKQGLVIEAKYEEKETTLGICSSKGGRIFANYTRSDNYLVRDDTSFDGDGKFITSIKPGTDVTLTFEPQPGYELAKVYCGDQLYDVQPQPDGTYQYVLPANRIVNDLTTVAAIFNKKKEYDVNNDGEVTITDAVIIVDEILKE